MSWESCFRLNNVAADASSSDETQMPGLARPDMREGVGGGASMIVAALTEVEPREKVVRGPGQCCPGPFALWALLVFGVKWSFCSKNILIFGRTARIQ